MLYPAIFICLCFIFLEPVSDNGVEPENTIQVVLHVLEKPYIVTYPQVFPYAKLLWVIALVCGFLGYERVFSLFGFLSMILIGTFQSMGEDAEGGFVWLVSNSVAMYIVGLYFLNEAVFPQNDFKWSHLDKSRLWLIAVYPVLLWCPIAYENNAFVWDFSLKHALLGDGCTAFCYVMPTLLATMCLFYPHVDRRLFGITTFVCSLFGASSMVVLGVSKLVHPLVMHIPLVVVSLYGYYLYFFANESDNIKEKNE